MHPNIQEYLELDKESRALAEQQTKIGARMKELEPKVVEIFIESGMQNVKAADGRTLYLSRNFYFSAKDRAGALEALVALGMTDFIKEDFNSTKVKSWLKEVIEEKREEQGEEAALQDPIEFVPERLRNFVTVGENTLLRIRNS